MRGGITPSPRGPWGVKPHFSPEGVGAIGGEAPYTKNGWWVGLDRSLRRNCRRRFRDRPLDAGRDHAPAPGGHRARSPVRKKKQNWGLTGQGRAAIIAPTISNGKPVRKRSSRHSKPSESPRWWERGGARPCEWTSEGGLNRETSVDADGAPPVIHRARVMAREASGRAGVNLGGIAGVQLLSHVGRGAVFLYSEVKAPGSGPSIAHPNTKKPAPTGEQMEVTP